MATARMLVNDAPETAAQRLDALVRIQNVFVEYGPLGKPKKCILNGVSLDIHPGEFISIVGKSGSGKSTLLNMVSCIDRPTSGSIYFGDIPLHKLKESELTRWRGKNIGIVFQDADNQIIASTVRAEVGFGPMNLKLPKEEVLERVEEALDPLNALMLEEVLAKLSSEGKTMLISTHDVDFAYRWAKRVLVFWEGKIIADGTPLEIFQNKEILKQANLKQPTLLEIYESLVEKHLLKDTKAYPKSTQEFKEIIEK